MASPAFAGSPGREPVELHVSTTLIQTRYTCPMRNWRIFFHRKSIRAVLRGALLYLFGKRGQRRVAGLRLFYRMRMMVILHSAQALGKLARVPEVRLWVDGPAAFRRIEKLLRRARHMILVQMFIWVDDQLGQRMAALLIEAADRGVQVEVTKEAVGDFFEIGGDFLATRHSERECWQRFWNHPRIRVTYATHNDHAKVYIIDDQVLLLTGMNIADDYLSIHHDFLVELRGRHFVEQYLMRRLPADDAGAVRLVMNTDDQKNVRRCLMQLLASARESIVVEHAYVSDPEVIEALLAALRRYVRVTVIMPTSTDLHYYANMSSIGRLLLEGRRLPLRVFLFEGRIHGKVLLVDQDRAFIGSANLIRSSLDDMGEVNVLVCGKKRFLHRLKETLREDILRSRPLTTPPPFWWVTRWMAWLGL